MQARHYSVNDKLIHFTMPEIIKAAKEAVVGACTDGKNRKWLRTLLSPYRGKSDGIELWALHGTPMRGMVIANHGTKEVMAFDNYDKRLKIKLKVKGSRKTISVSRV